MAIITTPGAIDANSYATLVEADAYHANRLHNSAWTGASDATKESALIWATNLLDANMGWHGYATTDTQALDWPRTGVVDKNGYTIDSDVIPQDLKNAQSELAFLLIVNDRTIGDDPTVPGATKVKAGPLEVTIDTDYNQLVLSSSVVAYIQYLGDFVGVGNDSGSSVAKLVRT